MIRNDYEKTTELNFTREVEEYNKSPSAIESKAESDSEERRNEAIKQANEIIEYYSITKKIFKAIPIKADTLNKTLEGKNKVLSLKRE